MRDSDPIGVFDSGVGGLTVVRELVRQLPYESVVYFGDTARLPYGIKSKETIVRFSIENVLFLLNQSVKFIVIACNTASSIALATLKRHFKVPIIGVIQPGIKQALTKTKKGSIGIIGTRATIRSGAYEQGIKNFDSTIKVFTKECPLFVPLVEEGWAHEEVTQEIARNYLSAFDGKDIDTLILGCTHYPLLKSVIQKVVGRHVSLIDSSQAVAIETKEALANEGLLNTRKKTPKYSFYVSDELTNFSIMGRRFLGRDLKNVVRVNHV